MSSASDTHTLLRDFDLHRPALFALAYRMLGSVMDAEDIVQEAFLRWQQVPMDQVASPKAYLLTITTRLCLDHLRSARARRETYIGPWLPEPLVLSDSDPDAALDRADTLSFAFLLLLERLTPLERAVFILHDVFGYTYDEVGQMIGSNAPYCRQLGHRARERVSTGRPRFEATAAQAEQAVHQFVRACTEGDMQGLLNLFANDITLWSDGGGKAHAARNPIIGADRVARFMLGVQRKVTVPVAIQPARVNGQIGLILWLTGQLYSVYVFDVDHQSRIRAIYVMLNPAKLRGVSFAP